MFRKVMNTNPLHLLSWAYQRSRRTAKLPAVETFLASEAGNEIMMLKDVLTKLFGI